MLPETTNPKPLPAKNSVPDLIGCVAIDFRMTPPIQLDDQSPAEANEIQIIPTKRRLPAKMDPLGAHTLVADPKANLGLGHRLAKFPGALCAHSRLPHPGRFAAFPSPQRGGTKYLTLEGDLVVQVCWEAFLRAGA